MRNLILFLTLLLSCQVSARPQRQQSKGNVQISVVSQQPGNTSDPARQLYNFSVKCTNLGEQAVRVSNNLFYVIDDAGQPHHVERARYPEVVQLEAGKSITMERIYIAVPRSNKPKELHLGNLGVCPLK